MARRTVKRPALSVVVVARNAERHIVRTVESVLGQDDDVQLVVVDCASTDRTVAICQSMAERDIRLDVLSLDEPNEALAFDQALEAARARYVLVLRQNDWLAPRALPAVLKALADEPVELGLLTLSVDEDFGTGERSSHLMHFAVPPMRSAEAFRDQAHLFIAAGLMSMLRGKLIDRDRANELGLRLALCGSEMAYMVAYSENVAQVAVIDEAVCHVARAETLPEADTRAYQRCEHNHQCLLGLLSAWHREHDAQLVAAVHRLHLRELIACIEGVCALRDISAIERNDRVRDMIEAPSTRTSVAVLGDASREFGFIYGPIARMNVTACCLSARLTQLARISHLPFFSRTGATLSYA